MVNAAPDRSLTLLERVTAGDQEAFTVLVEPHLPSLLSFAVRVAPDRAAGEDALQDVLAQAFQTLQRKPADELADLEVRPWLFKSVINRVRRVAARRREVPLGLTPRPPTTSVEATAGRHAMLELVDRELRRLPRDWRAAILLRHHAGYSNEEIALLLGRPSGTIKAWIHRGMERVREALPADIWEEADA